VDRPNLDPEHVAFAADGRALIVGVADEHGVPCATRGWGFRGAGELAVVLLDADDVASLSCLVPGRWIAVSAADVATFRSLQFKGAVVDVVPLTSEDRAALDHYEQTFYDAIVEVDGVPRALVERVTPSRFVACRFEPREIYDQTPGPGAGAPVATRA
jgi:hypothetical protein